MAVSLAKKYKKVAFIATCEPLDKEMAKRIKIHQDSRPKDWKTFEQPKDLSNLFEKTKNNFDCVLIDCLTLLVSNLMLEKNSENAILEKVNLFLAEFKKMKAHIIIVSNEVGLGIVPNNKLARDFRDIAGKVNQLVAKTADEVFFTVSGIPMKIKAGK